MAHLNLFLHSALRPATFSPLKSFLKKPTKSIFHSPEIHSAFSIKHFSRVVFAATGGRGRRSGQLKQYKRGISTRKEGSSSARKRSSEMDEEEPKDFNKKRMEGRDKAGPKQVKLKTRSINPVNTIAYVQVLGTGMDTHETSPSVLLFFDHQRFIFNAGEVLSHVIRILLNEKCAHVWK